MTDTTEVADVAVIGLGYIGLPTAAVLARAGRRPDSLSPAPGDWLRG